MKQLTNIFLLTFLLAFSVQAATLADAKIAIRTQNFGKAVSILKPLASKGDRQAQYQLAVMYRNGQGVAENPGKAAQWMIRSARQGYKRAQYSMAVLYEEGTAVKADRAKAIYWYKAAEKQGHKNASKRLKKMQAGEVLTPHLNNNSDPKQALIVAVSSGDVAAATMLLADGVSTSTHCCWMR